MMVGQRQDADGHWEYREFSQKMRGKIRYKFDGWPPESALPNKDLTWHIELAAKQLAAPLTRLGWIPQEPLDARSLWEAGRVEHTIEAKGLLPGKYEVALHRLRVPFRRWIAVTPGRARAPRPDV